MWVTIGSYVGHIQIVLWVSGTNKSTGATHFQTCTTDHVSLTLLETLWSTDLPPMSLPCINPHVYTRTMIMKMEHSYH